MHECFGEAIFCSALAFFSRKKSIVINLTPHHRHGACQNGGGGTWASWDGNTPPPLLATCGKRTKQEIGGGGHAQRTAARGKGGCGGLPRAGPHHHAQASQLRRGPVATRRASQRRSSRDWGWASCYARRRLVGVQLLATSSCNSHSERTGFGGGRGFDWKSGKRSFRIHWASV